MFAAGLGLGLMFYGVAEPISHFAAPPHGLAEPRTPEAAQVALETTYFHWGFNGWAIYAIMGLALAYFTYRRGGKNLVSATFVPLLGENASERPIGRVIDGLAIFATLFGTATSLGLGALQINSGMNFLWDVPISNSIGVAIIAVITALFVLSAVSGVEKGIQLLSNLSGAATIALMLFFLFAGPTVFIIGTSIETIGGYILNVFPMSLRMDTFTSPDWMAAWTIFYWAWWISWAPFVGTFVARISRGRTIREFIIGVVAMPTGMGFIWFAIVGSAGIDMQISGQADLIAHDGDARAVAVHRARAAAVLDVHVGALDDPDRVLLHQRRGRGGDRDGHARLARGPRAGADRDGDDGHPHGRDRLGAAARRRPGRAAAGRGPGLGPVHVRARRADVLPDQGDTRGGGAAGRARRATPAPPAPAPAALPEEG